MNPNDIINRLEGVEMTLSQKNDNYKELAVARAKAQFDYKVALAHKTMELKEAGHSVGLITRLADGDAFIADLRQKYETAVAVERACLESIKDAREAIGTYRSLLTWLREEKKGY